MPSHMLMGDAVLPAIAGPNSSKGPLKRLSVQIGATALFLASSCYATKQHCNSIDNFCKWSFFLQWTFWNTVSHNFLHSVTLQHVVFYTTVQHIASHMHCTALRGCKPTTPTPAESWSLPLVCMHQHHMYEHISADDCQGACVSFLACKAVVLLPGCFLSRSVLIFLTTVFPGNAELGLSCV